jgi:predicted enzyme related to lactoylglutathione lyase
MHRSRISTLVLDCPVADLKAAAEFWSAALGRKVETPDQDGDGKYAELETAAEEPFLLLQKVDHEARLHLDIETDDIDAEVARLEALGAKKIAFVKRWWIMQAPTGHRFCVVPMQPAKTTPEKEWP